MNADYFHWDYFSHAGWISVLVWLIVPLCWVVYSIKGPRRWLCPIGLGLAIVALVLAKDNSKNYVNLIQPDRSAEIAAQQERQEASRKALQVSRGSELSDVRFAEDTAADSLDRAGMDEDDLKYLGRHIKSATPDWKKEKKSRTAGGIDDGSVESAVGGDNAIAAADSEFLDGMEEEAPVVMLEEDLERANRLDALNLKVIYALIFFGLLMVVYDYLRRANIYAKASLPLPLPSAWINGLTPLPVVVEGAGPVGLSRLVKRGDSFVYLTDDKEAAAKIPEAIPRLPLGRKRIDVLRADGEQGSIDDDFIFETVWFGRSSFVVDSAGRSKELLDRFIDLLTQRKDTRAKVRQSMHLVWDLDDPIPEEQKQKLITLAKATGLSLYICNEPKGA
ncbi:MAG: hypothetical protein KJO21_11790 [Verrucomicrobiae bacterium]|nr:hypothetical protein [Verrucomicrobiae bacterium]NNJ43902.1 hypothetical protein [Akkermansiaceae bacterium]